jgi:hypothetical protein
MSDERGRPTLLEDIEVMHRGLKELQSVRDYVQVVSHALSLRLVFLLRLRSGSHGLHVCSESSVNHLTKSSTPLSLSHQAITEYQALDSFVTSVLDACKNVEDSMSSQKLHLVTFLEGIRDRTWNELKSALAK